ncbi:MAG: LapA family protein [Prolixibacteraceae bacterium]|nr:LapA family protein [Prolixibacteraceae bacterium]MBN2772873.1 LapA family protein [Prolixibacteraceae bacterium]
MQAIIIILLILAILLVIFTLQNSVGISITVFFWKITDAPLVLVLLVCIVSGYLLSTFYLLPKIWKLKKELNRIKKQRSEPKITNKPGTLIDDLDSIDSGNKDPEGMRLEDEEESSFFTD